MESIYILIDPRTRHAFPLMVLCVMYVYACAAAKSKMMVIKWNEVATNNRIQSVQPNVAAQSLYGDVFQFRVLRKGLFPFNRLEHTPDDPRAMASEHGMASEQDG